MIKPSVGQCSVANSTGHLVNKGTLNNFKVFSWLETFLLSLNPFGAEIKHFTRLKVVTLLATANKSALFQHTLAMLS